MLASLKSRLLERGLWKSGPAPAVSSPQLRFHVKARLFVFFCRAKRAGRFEDQQPATSKRLNVQLSEGLVFERTLPTVEVKETELGLVPPPQILSVCSALSRRKGSRIMLITLFGAENTKRLLVLISSNDNNVKHRT